MEFDVLGPLQFNSQLYGDSINRSRSGGAILSDFESLLRRTMPAASMPLASAETAAPVEGRETPPSSMPAASMPLASMPLASSPAESSSASSRFAVIDRDSTLYEQCVELEIFLVKNLLNSMRSTIQKSGLIDESFAGKMYEDMLYDEYARDLATNAGFGMAELAYLELTGQRGKSVIR